MSDLEISGLAGATRHSLLTLLMRLMGLRGEGGQIPNSWTKKRLSAEIHSVLSQMAMDNKGKGTSKGSGKSEGKSSSDDVDDDEVYNQVMLNFLPATLTIQRWWRRLKEKE